MILELRDANWKDGISELKSMRTQSVKEKRKAEEIYTYLSNAAVTNEDNDAIK